MSQNWRTTSENDPYVSASRSGLRSRDCHTLHVEVRLNLPPYQPVTTRPRETALQIVVCSECEGEGVNAWYMSVTDTDPVEPNPCILVNNDRDTPSLKNNN